MPKTGLPEEGELVQCTITSVQHHSVFVRMDEYNRTGMIHISEVAPGRIRNIRDFVAEGKTVVCKVLRVNPERGHVDLSLRRVSDSQRRNKVNELKQEKLANKLIEVVSFNLKKKPEELAELIASKVQEHYVLLFDCFTDIAKGDFAIKELGLPADVEKELEFVIKDRLKPEIIVSKGVLKLTSSAPDGVEVVRSSLAEAEKAGAQVRYMGGGQYSVSVSAPDHKVAESQLNAAVKAVLSAIKSKKGIGEFEAA